VWSVRYMGDKVLWICPLLLLLIIGVPGLFAALGRRRRRR
jgi:hypothetical protein